MKKHIESFRTELIEEIMMIKPVGKLLLESKLLEFLDEGVEMVPAPSDFYFEIEEWNGRTMTLVQRVVDDSDAPALEFQLDLHECGFDLLIQILNLA